MLLLEVMFIDYSQVKPRVALFWARRRDHFAQCKAIAGRRLELATRSVCTRPSRMHLGIKAALAILQGWLVVTDVGPVGG